MDESAEKVVALDRVHGWLVALVAACGCEESECSVRPLGVVVGDVAAEHVFEVAADDALRVTREATARSPAKVDRG